jgi:hypothetical protein
LTVHQLIGIANLNQLFSEIFILQVNVDNRVNRANRADRFSCVENRANSHLFRPDVVYPRRGYTAVAGAGPVAAVCITSPLRKSQKTELRKLLNG